jgi:hypothetical protein
MPQIKENESEYYYDEEYYDEEVKEESKKVQIEEIHEEDWDSNEYAEEIPDKSKVKAIISKSNSDEFS